LINIFVHLTRLKWSNSSDGFSSLLAIVACSIYTCFPFFVIKLLLANFKDLENSEIKESWSSLYEPMKTSNFPMVIYMPLFLFRRLIFSFSTVLLTDWPIFQVNMLFLQSVILLWYLINYQPFTLTILNYLEIFNELCILAVTYPCLLFTGYLDLDPEAHYNTGWFVIFIVLINIVVNIMIVAYQTLKALGGAIKRAWLKLKKYKNSKKS